MSRAAIAPAVLAAVLGAALEGCPSHEAPPYLRVSGAAPELVNPPGTRARLVVFWASWCPPCRKETPELLALAAQPPEGLSVVVLSHDVAMEDVQRLLGGPPDPRLHFRFDVGEASARAFGVEKLPTSFLVVEDALVARFDGPREWSSPGMRGLLRRLIDGAGTKHERSRN